MKRPRAVIFDRDDTGMAMNDALSGGSEILKAEKSLASKERIQITLEGEDAKMLEKISKAFEVRPKDALLISLLLGLAVSENRKPSELQISRPQHHSQDRASL